MTLLWHGVIRSTVLLSMCICLYTPVVAQAVVEMEASNSSVSAVTLEVAAAPDPSVVDDNEATTLIRSTLSDSKKSTSGQLMTPARLLGQVGVGLLLVTGLILMLAWLARRLGYQQYVGGRAMSVVAQLPLGNREKAVLIAVGNKHMLLGVAPGRVSFLSEIDGQLPEEDIQVVHSVPMQKGQEFARYLKSILAQGNKS